MKPYKLTFALLLGLGTLATSCEDKLNLTNPNQQTTGTYGSTADDLEECIVGTYKRIRMDIHTTSHAVMKCGTHHRLGTISAWMIITLLSLMRRLCGLGANGSTCSMSAIS